MWWNEVNKHINICAEKREEFRRSLNKTANTLRHFHANSRAFGHKEDNFTIHSIFSHNKKFCVGERWFEETIKVEINIYCNKQDGDGSECHKNENTQKEEKGENSETNEWEEYWASSDSCAIEHDSLQD